MKFTSKKIFYFAFIIILIGIIWTMFFSKSREGWTKTPGEIRCNKYNNGTGDTNTCSNNNCNPVKGGGGPGSVYCHEKPN